MRKFFRYLFRSSRGRTALALLIIAIVSGTAILAYVPERYAEVKHVLVEVCAAVLIVGVVDLLTKLISVQMELADREKFQRFFGSGAVHEGSLVIFPTARPVTVSAIRLSTARIAAHLDLLRDSGLVSPATTSHERLHDLADIKEAQPAAPGDADQHCALVFEDPPEAAGHARAKGIECVVPFEDLQAGLEISRLFHQMDSSCHFELDRAYCREDAPLPQRPLIAVGLGFNHVTTKVSRLCPDLFRIIYDNYTDDFLFGNEPHPAPDEFQDFALIVRAVDHGRGRKPSVHFVCAGRTASGTEAAGLFLANQWRELLNCYEKAHDVDRDSMAAMLKFNRGNISTARAMKIRFSPWTTADRIDDAATDQPNQGELSAAPN